MAATDRAQLVELVNRSSVYKQARLTMPVGTAASDDSDRHAVFSSNAESFDRGCGATASELHQILNALIFVTEADSELSTPVAAHLNIGFLPGS